jgi:hypothetical protein
MCVCGQRIELSRGIYQGHSLSKILFCGVIQTIVKNIRSEFFEIYLDDFFIGSNALKNVLDDVRRGALQN